MSDKSTEPTLAEIEMAMAASQDAEGNDVYLEAWRASLSPVERRRSRENLQAFITQARASLRD